MKTAKAHTADSTAGKITAFITKGLKRLDVKYRPQKTCPVLDLYYGNALYCKRDYKRCPHAMGGDYEECPKYYQWLAWEEKKPVEQDLYYDIEKEFLNDEGEDDYE